MASMKQFILCSNLFSKLDRSCFKEAIFILELAKIQILGKRSLAPLANNLKSSFQTCWDTL